MQYIIEESAASSKLNDFISNISDSEKKSVKNVLNGVYLYIKHKGFIYEEINKPSRSPYHGTFTKISGSKDLDQLSWKLKVSIPLNYSKQPVAQFHQDLRDEIKNIARKENGSYFYDSTNKDFYDAVGFNKDTIVEVGKHSDGTGVYYDHNNNIVKVVLVIKVVVKRVIEDKSNVDTSENHKAILSKVKSFIEPSEIKGVLKALDTIYDTVDKKFNGCIESKRIMSKSVELDTRKSSYEDKDKIIECNALVWKTELKSSSNYSFRKDDIVKSYMVEEPLIYVTLDSNNYTVGRTGDTCYVGIAHEYGSRGVEYLYFMVLRPELNPIKVDTSNPFLSKDGKNLKNKHVSVNYDRNKKEIFGADLEDMFNMPRFYTTKKQGIEKAWNDLIDRFNEDTTDSDCMRIIGYDKCHSYCAMD